MLVKLGLAFREDAESDLTWNEYLNAILASVVRAGIKQDINIPESSAHALSDPDAMEVDTVVKKPAGSSSSISGKKSERHTVAETTTGAMTARKFEKSRSFQNNSQPVSQLVASTSAASPPRVNSRPLCYMCSKPGHFSYQCKESKSKEVARTKPKLRIDPNTSIRKCYICHKKGHFAAQCKEKRPEANTSSERFVEVTEISGRGAVRVSEMATPHIDSIHCPLSI